VLSVAARLVLKVAAWPTATVTIVSSTSHAFIFLRTGQTRRAGHSEAVHSYAEVPDADVYYHQRDPGCFFVKPVPFRKKLLHYCLCSSASSAFHDTIKRQGNTAFSRLLRLKQALLYLL